MNILFITSTRIGDAVLSTGLLRHIHVAHPNAKVTVVCGPLAASLFEGYPNLARIIALKKQKRHGHWVSLWRETIGTRWDMIVDLRNSAVSRMIFAKKRHIFSAHIVNKAIGNKAGAPPAHKVIQNAAVMRLSADTPPAPKLWFTPAQIKTARGLIGAHDTPIIALGPTANWRAKTWAADNFSALAAWLLSVQSPVPNAKIAIFAAPNEKDEAYTVYSALPAHRRIDVIGKTDPASAAAALSLCDLYIGNDSGLMHCAAAVGTATIGLFGPSYPELYRPWGEHCAYVRTPQSFDALIDYEGYSPKTAPCLMGGITVDMAKDAVRRAAAPHLNTTAH